MKIYIPTHGRANGPQSAYWQMENSGLRPYLVVDQAELDAGADYSRFRKLAAPVKGIAQKRQWIVEHAKREKFMQMDDDMTLATVDKLVDTSTAIRGDVTPARLQKEITRAEELLDRFAHGGFHTRHFVNYQAQPYVMNRGYYRQIMCFNPHLFGKPAPRYEGNTAEDVRFMLHLLRQGKDYFIITSSCMIENVPRGQRTTWSHWNQEEKSKDMVELAKDYAPFAFQTADGRTALRYASILKHYKKELAK